MGEAEERRRAMVAEQIQGRGVKDERVLEAFLAVERHRFVPEATLEEAYGDHPLPIGLGQTISQPYMVARMTELLAPRPHHRVLEIGAGSGYQTAVLCRLSAHVVAMERLPELSARGQGALAALGITNVSWITGDGTLGYPAGAPYDGILVAAGAPEVPAPLVAQLREGGRLVVPVGTRLVQELQTVLVTAGKTKMLRDTMCRFVDLVGAHGWGGQKP